MILVDHTDKSLIAAEAYSVLILLGFKGVYHFAAKSGVNHWTVAQLIGTAPSVSGGKHVKAIQVNEALSSAYEERRSKMTAGTRAFLKGWIKRWRKWVVNEQLARPRQGDGGLSLSAAKIRNREDKRRKAQLCVKAALEALVWR